MNEASAQAEIAQLRLRLEEAEETLRAIRDGAVDAFVVVEASGERVYTLEGADRPYRVLVEQMQQGAVTLHDDGTIVYSNLRAAMLLGQPHPQLAGQALDVFVAPEHREAYKALLDDARRSISQGEIAIQREDGTRSPVYLTMSELPKISGAAVCVLITDLTAQKHQERLAAAHHALRQSEEALIEADRRKTEFLAMLAHELRSPLAPISNALRIIRMTPGDVQTVSTATDMMGRQVGQLVRLVDDLLDVSRISRGKIELRIERVELCAIVNQAVETVRTMCDEMQQEVKITLPPHEVYVHADPARLAQVIGNLLSNACKFTPSGGLVSIDVSVDSSEGHAILSVEDTGVGIAQDQLPRIFELFTQVDATMERSQGGLGIGLTLVKTLVEMHGGNVEAESKGIGRGSTFRVRLPVITSSTLDSDQSTVDADRPRSRPCRILVVDDNQDSAESLAMLLSLSGHSVRTANDGLAALEAARSFRPRVVLMDLGMPRLNGYEAARAIRAEEWGRDVMLVALTGWGQEEDKRRTAEAGFNAHLTKPVDHFVFEQLLTSLDVDQAGTDTAVANS